MQSTNLISKNQNISLLSDPVDPKDTVAIKDFSYDYDVKEGRGFNGAIIPVYWATIQIKGTAILFRDGSCNVMNISVWDKGHDVTHLAHGFLYWDVITKSVTAWVKEEVFPEYILNVKTA